MESKEQNTSFTMPKMETEENPFEHPTTNIKKQKPP